MIDIAGRRNTRTAEIEGISDDTKEGMRALISNMGTARRGLSLGLGVSDFGDDMRADVQRIFQPLARRAERMRASKQVTVDGGTTPVGDGAASLPRVITFPYSRHSSYPEQCRFVEAFRPRDVWPCTTNTSEWLGNNISIARLFGRYCSGKTFSYDRKLDAMREEYVASPPPEDSQKSQATDRASSPVKGGDVTAGPHHQPPSAFVHDTREAIPNVSYPPEPLKVVDTEGLRSPEEAREDVDIHLDRAFRSDAYNFMLGNMADESDWQPVRLFSVTGNHNTEEKRLL